MKKHNHSHSVWGELDRIRFAWTQYIVVLAWVFFLFLVCIIWIWPLPWDVAVDSLLPTWRPSPWPVPLEPAAVAGCYELSFGEWEPKINYEGDAIFVTAPSKIELTTEPQKWQEGWFVMRRAPGAAPSIHQMTSWYVTPSRTIVLVWSTGTSGLTAELGPAGSDLRGRAKTFWDFPRGAQVASVTARKYNCREPKQIAYENPTPEELKDNAKILAILQEPGFCSAPLPKGAVESYRFLWLRTFDPAVLIHLTIFNGEHAVATYKESDGASGYEIHKLKVNRTFNVKQPLTNRTKVSDMYYLSAMIQAIREAADRGLWNQPYRLEDSSIRLDGSAWIVEGVRSTGCHLVTRWSPNEGDPVRELANLLIIASGKRFYYDEVY